MRKQIAVIGAGVSGLVCARLLALDHDVTLWEAGSSLGGHARTVEFEAYGRSFAADIGFMVFNRRTYPNFCRLLQILGVSAQPSDMSFSVSVERPAVEYQGSSLNGLFAQRSNLLRPSFLRMLRDIVRFNREATAASEPAAANLTLGEYVDRGGYGPEFLKHYLLPMTAAIWSAPPSQVEEFPAWFLLRFFKNHGLVQLRDRPQWLTIAGGSRRYVSELARPLQESIRLATPAKVVEQGDDGVVIHGANGERQSYDYAVLATHAPESLAMLHPLNSVQREVLSEFRYQTSEAVLHTDHRLLPSRRRAWASWNYRVYAGDDRATVTYDLNRLQRLGAPYPICLTLNPPSRLPANGVLSRFHFDHPLYSRAAIAAQARWEELHRSTRVFLCGAYWGNGFHEDGVNSALAVCRRFGRDLGDLSCTAASTSENWCTSAAGR